MRALQRPDGSFSIAPSDQRPPKHKADAIFSTASVLIAAGALLPRAAVTAAAEYVAKRRRRDGLWEWEGCPADADDSAICLAALIGPGLLDGSEASCLRQFWREPSGPFRTWPNGFGSEKWSYDPVVNCNVLYCLIKSGIAVLEKEVQAVNDCVERALTAARRYSGYYPSKSTLLYVAARARLKPIILDSISSGLQPNTLNAQQTAEVLAASPRPNPDLIHRLLASQAEDGRWIGAPWFFDVAGDYCSDAYATAVAVQALHRLAVR